MIKKEVLEAAKKLFAENKKLEKVWMCSNGIGYNDEHNARQYQKTVNKQEEPLLVEKKALKELLAKVEAPAGNE